LNNETLLRRGLISRGTYNLCEKCELQLEPRGREGDRVALRLTVRNLTDETIEVDLADLDVEWVDDFDSPLPYVKDPIHVSRHHFRLRLNFRPLMAAGQASIYDFDMVADGEWFYGYNAPADRTKGRLRLAAHGSASNAIDWPPDR
jgi:hypothetical protein